MQKSLDIIKFLKSQKVRTLGPVIFTAIFGLICTFNIIFGKRGVVTFFELKSRLPETRETLDTLRAERLRLENQAELLRESSLDLDMLDEKARKILDFAKTKESILILKRNDH